MDVSAVANATRLVAVAAPGLAGRLAGASPPGPRGIPAAALPPAPPFPAATFPAAPPSPDQVPEAGLRVPLHGRDGRLAGVILLGERLSEEPYSSEDRRLLTSVASQAALALENIRLAEQIALRLEAERRAAVELELAKEVQSRLLPRRGRVQQVDVDDDLRRHVPGTSLEPQAHPPVSGPWVPKITGAEPCWASTSLSSASFN